MIYEPRTYRQKFSHERFTFFEIHHFESDLFIGIDKNSYNKDIPVFSLNELKTLRKELDDYISFNPSYKASLAPLEFDPKAPLIAQEMMIASGKADVGPMAAVAGAFAEWIGKKIKKSFYVNEIIIENGGDIYLLIKEPLVVALYAGKSSLSEKVAVNIDPSFSPVGVCTSSGTVGHSLSFGKADAMMIACHSVSLADAYATAYSNQIQDEKDIDSIISQIRSKVEILSAVAIKERKLGVCGRFKLTFYR